MKFFIAASYSAHVDYDTGEVFSEHKTWLEKQIGVIEQLEHDVFCALRADQYKINNDDPSAAFQLDMKHIQQSDVVLALLGDTVSAGVSTEIGIGVALGKKVILAHEHPLAYFNHALVRSHVAHAISLPLRKQDIEQVSK